MTTVPTKHRRQGPPPDVPKGARIGMRGAILDDMDSPQRAELPQRRSKNTTEGHSVVFGAEPTRNHFRSLKNIDYNAKQHSATEREQAREDQLGRVSDMNTKHFSFGDHPRTMVSELRGTLLPPSKEVLASRQIRPIGGPNNKGASNLFVSDKDRSDWATTMLSTSRQDFRFDESALATTRSTRGDMIRHIKAMRSSHFDVGHDKSKWSSTVQADFVAQNEGRANKVPPKGSSVPLCSGLKADRGGDFVSVNRREYGMGASSATPLPAGQVLPHIKELQRTHMVLGYDARELRTENKSQFKRATFVAAAPEKAPPATFTP
eukprot:Hpha_TRINITY_DN16222_c1_g10::TRINITY_DN16222_c1_g10_i1::g.11285::m.11285